MMNSPAPIWSPSRAEQVIQDRCKRLRFDLKPKFDVEALLLKLDAVTCPMYALVARFKIEAAVIRASHTDFTPRKFIVAVDETIYDGRESYFRLVVAEEIAHLIFDEAHVSQIKTLHDAIEYHQLDGWEAVERNREMCGRVLLMPTYQIMNKMPRLYSMAVDACGYTDQAKLFIQIELEKHFGVPADQVKKRLKECPGDLWQRINLSISAGSDTLIERYQPIAQAVQYKQMELWNE